MPTPTISRILFPTDFSSCAENAYRHAAYLADRFGAELQVLHVVEDPAAPERDWPEDPGTGHLRVSMADICADLRLPPPEADADVDAVDLIEVVETEVVGRKAAPAILDVAYDEEADLIVMGTHGRTGLERGVLGSVAEAVARRAPCPVLLVRSAAADADAPWPPSRVLLAVDVDPFDPVGSAVGYAEGRVPAAARWAARLAEAYRAPLDVVHVTSPAVGVLGGPAEAARLREQARGVLRALAGALDGGHLDVDVTVRSGDPADAVLTVAEEAHTHLLVVGTHGRTGAERALLGSVAEELVRTAPCPVLVVRDVLAEAPPEAAGARAEVTS